MYRTVRPSVFLLAPKFVYERLCQLVGRSVGRSVGQSVGHAIVRRSIWRTARTGLLGLVFYEIVYDDLLFLIPFFQTQKKNIGSDPLVTDKAGGPLDTQLGSAVIM